MLTFLFERDPFYIRMFVTAAVDITTDSQRPISYFFEPNFRNIYATLGER